LLNNQRPYLGAYLAASFDTFSKNMTEQRPHFIQKPTAQFDRWVPARTPWLSSKQIDRGFTDVHRDPQPRAQPVESVSPPDGRKGVASIPYVVLYRDQGKDDLKSCKKGKASSTASLR
jgi:hypothetical protein